MLAKQCKRQFDPKRTISADARTCANAILQFENPIFISLIKTILFSALQPPVSPEILPGIESTPF